jgi:hypothetical protein
LNQQEIPIHPDLGQKGLVMCGQKLYDSRFEPDFNGEMQSIIPETKKWPI